MKINLLFILAFGLLTSDSVLSNPKIDTVSNIQSHYRWLQKDELPVPAVKIEKVGRNNKTESVRRTERRTRPRGGQ